MKKENKSMILAVVIVVVITVILSVVTNATVYSKVELSDGARAELYYDNADIYFNSNMSDEHSAQIAKCFDSKRLDEQTVADGLFSEKIYLSFEDQGEIKNFYIACDGSGKIKHQDKYFDLSAEENTQLLEILVQYGAKFPCD